MFYSLHTLLVYSYHLINFDFIGKQAGYCCFCSRWIKSKCRQTKVGNVQMFCLWVKCSCWVVSTGSSRWSLLHSISPGPFSTEPTGWSSCRTRQNNRRRKPPLWRDWLQEPEDRTVLPSRTGPRRAGDGLRSGQHVAESERADPDRWRSRRSVRWSEEELRWISWSDWMFTLETFSSECQNLHTWFIWSPSEASPPTSWFWGVLDMGLDLVESGGWIVTVWMSPGGTQLVQLGTWSSDPKLDHKTFRELQFVLYRPGSGNLVQKLLCPPQVRKNCYVWSEMFLLQHLRRSLWFISWHLLNSWVSPKTSLVLVFVVRNQKSSASFKPKSRSGSHFHVFE